MSRRCGRELEESLKWKNSWLVRARHFPRARWSNEYAISSTHGRRAIPQLHRIFAWRFGLDVLVVNHRSAADGESNAVSSIGRQYLLQLRQIDGFDQVPGKSDGLGF